MILGLQRSRSLWLIAFIFLSILCSVDCKCRCIPAVASREMPRLKKLKLIFSLNRRSLSFMVKVSTFHPYNYIIAHKLSVLPGCYPENLKMYTSTVLLSLAASIVPDLSNMLLSRLRANIVLMSLL